MPSPGSAGIRCCRECGEPIGVYEPMVYAAGELIRRTSRALEPQLEATGPGLLFHAACFDGLEASSSSAAGA